MNDSPVFSDKAVLQYLLGVLPESDLTHFEEESIANARFFERIEIAEDKLIRDFLDEKLSAEERALFVEKYFSTPALHRKVTFAQNLRAVAWEEMSRPAARKGWFVWPRLWMPILSAATVIVIGVFVFNGRTASNVSKTSVTQNHSEGVEGPIVSILLLPGSERGSHALDRRLTILPVTRRVAIDLRVPGQTPPRANIELVRVAEPRDEKIASQTVDGQPAKSARSFVLKLSPALLADGTYIAYLRWWPPAADAEPDESFVFSVGRETAPTGRR
jgi:hypothetical protein